MVEKYQAYRDNKNRLYIVLSVRHDVVKLRGQYMSSPTVVKLLQLPEKQEREVSVVDFLQWEAKGTMTKTDLH